MSAILVTGATGTVGSAVVRELVARGVPVRAFVRDADKAAALLGDGVELAVGDFADAGSIDRALAGVERVFLACGNVADQLAHEVGLIDAAALAGVDRIVKLSANGAEPGSPLAFWDAHGRIERHLAASGVPAVVLRPNNYLTNLLASAPAVAQTGSLFAPAGDAVVAMVDPRDVAAVAAVCLTGDSVEAATHVVTGPAALTHTEITAAVSEATGRTIAFVDVPPDAARRGLLEAGTPAFLADFLVGAVRRAARGRPGDGDRHRVRAHRRRAAWRRGVRPGPCPRVHRRGGTPGDLTSSSTGPRAGLRRTRPTRAPAALSTTLRNIAAGALSRGGK